MLSKLLVGGGGLEKFGQCTYFSCFFGRPTLRFFVGGGVDVQKIMVSQLGGGVVQKIMVDNQGGRGGQPMTKKLYHKYLHGP